jgi:hypothetical protein
MDNVATLQQMNSVWKIVLDGEMTNEKIGLRQFVERTIANTGCLTSDEANTIIENNTTQTLKGDK